MYLQKEGYPEEGEIVYCEVKKITHNTVFVNLKEYNKDALLPVPEIAPGRIRNLRDYVKPGKHIVCVVLMSNPSKDHIVVSLRRVSSDARRKKMDQIKQELSAEGLINYVANKLKKNPKEIYFAIYDKIKEQYPTMYDFFIDVVENKVDISKYVKDKKVAKELKEHIFQRVKPKSVEKKAVVKIITYEEDGVEKIKNTFSKIYELDEKKYPRISLSCKYLGGGNYEIKVVAKEFEDANKLIEKAIEILSNEFEDKQDVEFDYKVYKGSKLN